MKLTSLKEGVYTRPKWKSLVVVRINNGDYYVDIGLEAGVKPLRPDSTAYKACDFEELKDEHLLGIIYKQVKKFLGAKMFKTSEEVKVVVVGSDGACAGFASEEEALEFVADRLEDNNKLEHTMFKPYQKVVPRKVDLSDLIVKL